MKTQKRVPVLSCLDVLSCYICWTAEYIDNNSESLASCVIKLNRLENNLEHSTNKQ